MRRGPNFVSALNKLHSRLEEEGLQSSANVEETYFSSFHVWVSGDFQIARSNAPHGLPRIFVRLTNQILAVNCNSFVLTLQLLHNLLIPLTMTTLRFYSLLLIWSLHVKADNFPCGGVCECSGNQQQSFPGLLADCSGRNLKNLPVRLPDDTEYL